MPDYSPQTVPQPQRRLHWACARRDSWHDDLVGAVIPPRLQCVREGQCCSAMPKNGAPTAAAGRPRATKPKFDFPGFQEHIRDRAIHRPELPRGRPATAPRGPSKFKCPKCLKVCELSAAFYYHYGSHSTFQGCVSKAGGCRQHPCPTRCMQESEITSRTTGL